jgi:hypothetical protein
MCGIVLCDMAAGVVKSPKLLDAPQAGRAARHLIENSRIQPHGITKVSPGIRRAGQT